MDEARGKIAIAFHCPVWVLHQLHGDVQSKSPTVPLHHKDAKGARNIGDNSDFAFNIGNREMTKNLVIVSCTKHRRAKGLDKPHIVEYCGEFSAFKFPNKKYVVDSTNNSFCTEEEMNCIDLGSMSNNKFSSLDVSDGF